MTPLALPRSELDGERVDQLIDEILRRREFIDAEPSALAQFRDDVRQWFLEALASIFDSGGGTLLGWLLLGAASLLAVALVVRATRRLTPGGGTVASPVVVLDATRSARQWLQDARDATSAGRGAEAVRCAYRAVVAALASRGALEEVPGRTVGEYRSRLAVAAPSDLESFRTVADAFERAWYARRPVAPDVVERVLGEADTIVDGRA